MKDFPSFRLAEAEVVTGLKRVGCRPAGFVWEPRHELVIEFKSRQEREFFIKKLQYLNMLEKDWEE